MLPREIFKSSVKDAMIRNPKPLNNLNNKSRRFKTKLLQHMKSFTRKKQLMKPKLRKKKVTNQLQIRVNKRQKKIKSRAKRQSQ